MRPVALLLAVVGLCLMFMVSTTVAGTEAPSACAAECQLACPEGGACDAAPCCRVIRRRVICRTVTRTACCEPAACQPAACQPVCEVTRCRTICRRTPVRTVLVATGRALVRILPPYPCARERRLARRAARCCCCN